MSKPSEQPSFRTNRPDPGFLRELKTWARRLKEHIYALYLVGRDPRTPLLAKLVVLIVVGYALSPIDLIPDFIPLLGYLDDLLLLPLGLALAIRLTPPAVWESCLAAARNRSASQLPRNQTAAKVIIGSWAFLLGVFLYWFFRT